MRKTAIYDIPVKNADISIRVLGPDFLMGTKSRRFGDVFS